MHVEHLWVVQNLTLYTFFRSLGTWLCAMWVSNMRVVALYNVKGSSDVKVAWLNPEGKAQPNWMVQKRQMSCWWEKVVLLLSESK